MKIKGENNNHIISLSLKDNYYLHFEHILPDIIFSVYTKIHTHTFTKMRLNLCSRL